MMRFFYCLFCLIFFFQLSAQERNRSAGDTDKVNTLLLLAGELDYSDPDSSILLAEHALKLSQKFNWKQGIGRSHHLLGRLFCNKANYRGSFDHYSNALRVWDDILVHDPLYSKAEKIKTVGNIGVVYQEQGNLTEALVYMFSALKMAEESRDKPRVSQQLSNIGIVYSDLGQLDKSLGYYLRAVNIDEELGNREGVSATLGNIGEIYDRKGDLARAFVYYSRALKMGEEVGDLDIVSINLGNIGNIHAEQGNFEEALEYYYKALKIEEGMGAESGVAFMLGTIGSLYVDLKQFELAENFLKRSIALNERIGAVKQLVQDEKYISDLYLLIGKPELALDHYKKYIVARDSVFNIESTRKHVSEELGYEFEKKSALQKAEHEKEVLALESEKKLEGQLKMFLFIVLALALLLLLFVHRAYKNKKQHAAHLLEEDSRKQLLLQEVHHRINNNLQIISSLLSLQAEAADDEKLRGYLEQSQGRIHSLAALHELLYDNSSSIEIDMNEYLDKLMNYNRNLVAVNKHIQINMDVASVRLTPKSAVPVGLIVNELFTNAVKHAFKETSRPAIKVCLDFEYGNKDKLMLEFSDNGCGLPAPEKMQPDSLGLRLVNMMSRQIGTTVSSENKPGATFTISFNIK